MFFGEQVHALDDKGRLTMPAKYRSQLADGMMITKGEDYCLHIYPAKTWQRKQAEVLARGTGTREDRNYMRAVFAGAEEGEFDNQGRVLLRPVHRTYARLDKDCSVIGMGEFVEVWDASSWEEERRRADAAIGERNDETT